VPTFVEKLVAEVTADTSEFYENFDKVAKTVENTADKVASASKRMALALSAAGGAALYFATSFETGMAEVSTLVDTTLVDMQNLEDGVRSLSVEFGESHSTMTTALYNTLSAGVDATESIELLSVANRAAIAGVTDVNTSLRGIVQTLNAYGMGTDQAERVSDIFFSAVKEGVLTFPQLASGLGRVTGIAATAGIPLEELTASLATLTKGGIQFDEAVTAVRQAIVTFISPTKEAQEIAQELGVELSATALKSKGLGVALREIEEAAGDNVEALAALFPNVRAFTAVSSLAGKQADEFGRIIEANVKSQGASAEAYEKMAKTAGRALKKIKSFFMDVMITLGEALLPKLIEFTDWVEKNKAEWMSWVKENAATIAAWGATALSIAAVTFALSTGVSFIAKYGGKVVWLTDKLLRLTFTAMDGLPHLVNLAKAHPWAAMGIAVGAAGFAVGSLIAKYTQLDEKIADLIAKAPKEMKAHEDVAKIQAAARAEALRQEEILNKAMKEGNIELIKRMASRKKNAELAKEYLRKIADAEANLVAEQKRHAAAVLAMKRDHWKRATQDFKKNYIDQISYLRDALKEQFDEVKGHQDRLQNLQERHADWSRSIDRSILDPQLGGLDEGTRAVSEYYLARTRAQEAAAALARSDYDEFARLQQESAELYRNIADVQIAEGEAGYGIVENFREAAIEGMKDLQELGEIAWEEQEEGAKGLLEEAQHTFENIRKDLSDLKTFAERHLQWNVELVGLPEAEAQMRAFIAKMREELAGLGELGVSIAGSPTTREPGAEAGPGRGTTEHHSPTHITTHYEGDINLTLLGQPVGRELTRSVIIPEIATARKRGRI